MFDRCLYFNVNALARLVNKQWREAFAAFDLSPSHGYMLRVVLANPGITQKELAVALTLEKSTVTRFVSALQEKGLVVRTSDGQDGREINIHPTAQALALHEPLEELGERLYQNMVNILGQEELTTLVGQLRQGTDKLV